MGDLTETLQNLWDFRNTESFTVKSISHTLQSRIYRISENIRTVLGISAALEIRLQAVSETLQN